MNDNKLIEQLSKQLKHNDSAMCNRWQLYKEDAKEIIHLVRDDLESQNEALMAEIDSLALYLWKTHYRADSPDFELLSNPLGVLSQIDNMVTGLVREQSLDSLKARIEEETIERCKVYLFNEFGTDEVINYHKTVARKYQPSTKAAKG